MRFVSPMDSVYLWGESGANPAHVIGVQVFAPPPSAPEDLLTRLYAEMTDPSRVKPEFRRRPHRAASTAGQFTWVQDDDLDMAGHVRRVTLPRPGRVRELFEHISEFHSTLLDRDRPLWEAHLVDGLADGGFAVCTKMHHAVVDGVALGRHMMGGLSPDPDDRRGTAPWIVPVEPATNTPSTRPTTSALGQVWKAIELPGKLAGSTRALIEAGMSVAKDADLTVPFSAPMTILNGPISSTRRFAGQSWPAQRLRAVARAAEVSSNDVALAMCSAALRSYLLDQDALPDSTLVAMVPISFRPRTEEGHEPSGNNWGAVLCPLGTDRTDPLDRLRRINQTMTRNKTLMSGLDPAASALFSAATMGGLALNALPALPPPPRPPFNLIISNVPAARDTLFLNGAELIDSYPVSIVASGQALNITLATYAQYTAVGITGCPRTVPHLQHLLKYLEAALADLEEGLSIPPAG